MPAADLRAPLPGAALALTLAAVLAACSSSSKESGPAASSTASAAPASPTAAAAPPAGSAAAAPTATSAAGAGEESQVVSIPAGKLVAGTACGDHPRVPAEELAGESIELGAFTIDAYPYPNDPSKPPMTGVTQDEARQLCEARGRRLCTELEWERACKGPSNTRYEYGDRFDPKVCPSGLGAVPRPEHPWSPG